MFKYEKRNAVRHGLGSVFAVATALGARVPEAEPFLVFLITSCIDNKSSRGV